MKLKLTDGREVELTELEVDVCRRILTDDYNGRGDEAGTPWSWSVTDGSHVLAGALGSLCRKGVCFSQDYEGKGRSADFFCGFTKEARPAIREVFLGKVAVDG